MDSLLIPLFSPGIGRVAIAPSLPIARLILNGELDSFKPFGALVKIAIGHQGSHGSAVGSG
jgi:hypothetical protein